MNNLTLRKKNLDKISNYMYHVAWNVVAIIVNSKSTQELHFATVIAYLAPLFTKNSLLVKLNYVFWRHITNILFQLPGIFVFCKAYFKMVFYFKQQNKWASGNFIPIL